MALRPCGECAAQISDRATKCPHCGSPTGEVTRRVIHGTAMAAKIVAAVIGIMFILIVVGAALIFSYWETEGLTVYNTLIIPACVGFLCMAGWMYYWQNLRPKNPEKAGISASVPNRPQPKKATPLEANTTNDSDPLSFLR